MPEPSGRLRWLLKFPLVAAAGVLLALLAARSAVLQSLPDSLPIAALVAPANPHVVRARTDVEQSSLLVSGASAGHAAEMLKKDLLAADPFLIAGLRAMSSGNGRANALLIEARRRNPRSQLTRLLVLDAMLRQGRTADAIGELSVLTRIMPEASGILMFELESRAADPKLRPALARALGSNRLLRDRFLKHLASQGREPELIFALAGPPESNKFRGGSDSWQQMLVTSLIRRERYGEARALWRSFLPESAVQTEALLYNSSFLPLRAPPPFNWQMDSGSEGVAERNAQGGLDVEYYGRGRVDLARQTLTLPPGSYSFSLLVDGASGEGGATLGWQLVCLPAGSLIMSLDLSKLPAAGGPLSATFSVPAGCPAQQLRLRGLPGEFADSRTMTLRDLNLQRAQ